MTFINIWISIASEKSHEQGACLYGRVPNLTRVSIAYSLYNYLAKSTDMFKHFFELTLYFTVKYCGKIKLNT